MPVPGRLEVAKDGRITGPANIAYNHPFPTVNGWSNMSGAIQGVVMHTMLGDLPGTIELFNNPAPGGDPRKAVSAHFGIGQDGSIHQFGPIGRGWVAWAQGDGNLTWYSIEHADNGNQENPLTPQQISASAQLFEVLSRFAGFGMWVTDRPAGRGYGTHVMGGAAWGGHSCPGPGPRAGQRADIIELAKQIRGGMTYTTTGQESLLEVGAKKGVAPSAILRMTAIQDRFFHPDLAAYINAGSLTAPMPKGIVLQTST